MAGTKAGSGLSETLPIMAIIWRTLAQIQLPTIGTSDPRCPNPSFLEWRVTGRSRNLRQLETRYHVLVTVIPRFRAVPRRIFWRLGSRVYLKPRFSSKARPSA